MKPIGTPERILRVSAGYFSVARYAGGCTLNGAFYVYDPRTDTLTRADVLRREELERARRVVQQQELWEAAQRNLFPEED